jgi:hypothetical protein
MKEVLLYGITKEPVYGVIGSMVEMQEYSRYHGIGAQDILPVDGGKYFFGNYGGQGEITRHSLPIHTMVLNRVDYHGRHHREERHIAFTPEFIQEIGGNPIELKESNEKLHKRCETLCNDITKLDRANTLLKLELSTASFWKRLKWVFTGVEV